MKCSGELLALSTLFKGEVLTQMPLILPHTKSHTQQKWHHENCAFTVLLRCARGFLNRSLWNSETHCKYRIINVRKIRIKWKAKCPALPGIHHIISGSGVFIVSV